MLEAWRTGSGYPQFAFDSFATRCLGVNTPRPLFGDMRGNPFSIACFKRLSGLSQRLLKTDARLIEPFGKLRQALQVATGIGACGRRGALTQLGDPVGHVGDSGMGGVRRDQTHRGNPVLDRAQPQQAGTALGCCTHAPNPSINAARELA